MSGILATFRLLTSVPLGGSEEVRHSGFSLACFPLVGLAIGGLLVGLDHLLGLFLDPLIVDIFLIVSLAGITGGLHLDGFADTCDGLAGGRTRETRLAIMKDSRAGSLGVVAVVLLLLLKLGSLAVLPESQRFAALLLMPALARWTAAYAAFAFPSARGKEGLGASFKEGARWFSFAGATGITLAASLLIAGLAGPAVMIASWVVALAAAEFMARRLGGLTGDTYGAIIELVEVGALILLPLVAQAI